MSRSTPLVTASDGGPSAGLTLLIGALLLLPVLGYRMGLDQGTFAYVSAGLAEGRWPYLETWDHQFPGGMILHALEILALGRSTLAFRLADLALQLVNIYLIYRITLAVADRPAAFLAGCLFPLIYQSYGPWNTAQREGFGLCLVLASFQLYLTRDRRPGWATAWWVGLCFGAATLIKPTLLALVALFAPCVEWPIRRRWLAPTLRHAAVWLAGLLLPSALVIAFYWWQDGLRDLYEATIAYQTEVYLHRLRGSAPLWQFWISKLLRLGREAVLLAVASAPLLLVGRRRRLRLMIFTGYLASLYTVFVQGTFAGYHYLVGLGFGAILVGSGFHEIRGVMSRLADRIGLRLPMVRASTVACLLLVAVLPRYMTWSRFDEVLSLRFLEPPRPGLFRVGTVFDYTESYDLAAYLRERTSSTDRIQIWGHESLVYYLADRLAASRFQSTNGLVMRVPGEPITPMQRRWRREFMAAMESCRPVFIVVVRDDHWWWAPGERSSEQLLPDFPEFERLIARAYSRETTIGRYVVYRRVSSSSRP